MPRKAQETNVDLLDDDSDAFEDEVDLLAELGNEYSSRSASDEDTYLESEAENDESDEAYEPSQNVWEDSPAKSPKPKSIQNSSLLPTLKVPIPTSTITAINWSKSRMRNLKSEDEDYDPSSSKATIKPPRKSLAKSSPKETPPKAAASTSKTCKSIGNSKMRDDKKRRRISDSSFEYDEEDEEANKKDTNDDDDAFEPDDTISFKKANAKKYKQMTLVESAKNNRAQTKAWLKKIQEEEKQQQEKKNHQEYEDIEEYGSDFEKEGSQYLELPVEKRILDPAGRPKDQPPTLIPSSLAVHLKPHQLDGLQFVWRNIVLPPKDDLRGCVLAHSMGLGKTLTTVTFIYMFLKMKKGKTAIVVLPKSVMTNWSNELRSWIIKADLREIDTYEMDSVALKTEFSRQAMVRRWKAGGGVLLVGFELFSKLMCVSSSKSSKNKEAKEFTSAQKETIEALSSTDLVIVDEGHKIKNPKTLLNRALENIKTRNRLVLTGTPLQNHLMEYYYMIQFIRPNYWAEEEFKDIFADPITRGQAKDSSATEVRLMKYRSFALTQELNNFVHRRDVSILRKELPERHEFIIRVNLTPIQTDLYRAYLKAERPNTMVLQMFSILGKIANHPDLLRSYVERARAQPKKAPSLAPFLMRATPPKDSNSFSSSNNNNNNNGLEVIDLLSDDDTDAPATPATPATPAISSASSSGTGADIPMMEDDWSWAYKVVEKDYKENDIEKSSKMVVLLEIIRESVAANSKLLVFSQFVETLDCIERFLKANPVETDDGKVTWRRDHTYYRLDGSTAGAARQKMVDQFNKEHATQKLFLISTKAGGLGLNLTGANRVVLFDVSWNPANDQQAIFRVFRYGQTKPVYIYRLVAARTVEDKVFKRVMSKMWLAHKIVDKKTPVRNLRKDDLQLFALDEPEEAQNWKHVAEADDILTNLYQSFSDYISSVVQHDTLYSEDLNDKISKEEQEASKAEYDAERNFRKTYSKEGFSYSSWGNNTQDNAAAALSSQYVDCNNNNFRLTFMNSSAYMQVTNSSTVSSLCAQPQPQPSSTYATNGGSANPMINSAYTINTVPASGSANPVGINPTSTVGTVSVVMKPASAVPSRAGITRKNDTDIAFSAANFDISSQWLASKRTSSSIIRR